VKERKMMIQKGSPLSVRRQSELLEFNRSRLYYKAHEETDTVRANLIAEAYRQHPMYGYRRIQAHLKDHGEVINRKCVLRLMRELQLKAIYPAPKTTVGNKAHEKSPYLLSGVTGILPHQAWQVDITYLRTNQGFLYLSALIDMRSRYVVGWSLSNSLDTEGCLRALENAIVVHGIPEMINSDQGSQFTSHDWTQALASKGILISMSGQGRSNDNAYIERLWRSLKCEWTFIKGARTVEDYKTLLPQFFEWYNSKRPHQALGYKTPARALEELLYGYVDKARALPHIPTKASSTSDSLIFV
jgi:putative transposase